MALGTKKGVATALATLLLSTLATLTQAQDLTLPEQGTDPVTLHLTDETLHAEMLKVYVSGAKTPIAGHYNSERDTLSFAPAFGFEPGQDYVAHILTKGEEAQVTFRIPVEAAIIPAAVTEIYPSGDTLPENTLRFYIHFTVPMQPHVAFDYIKLRDASGAADDAAFMRFKQELWNEDRTRLTVLIDPGRIKRSVATNLELGPALLEGERYILTVDGGWPSADGASVLPAFSKSFTVGEALRERPDVRLWQSTLPCPGTKEALEINFDRPIDRHRLDTELRLVTHDGQAIDGTPRIGENETFWRFVPNEVWAAGDLYVTVNSALEDVAGNNFRDLLDQRVGNEDFDPSVTTLQVHLSSCPR